MTVLAGDGSAAGPDAAGARTVVLASEMRSGVALTTLGASAVVVVLVFVHHTFSPLVRPAYLLTGWVAAMATVLALWAAMTVRYLWKPPADAD
ncbi:MAG TPA: hypothetical protein VGC92_03240, partial [Phenylobacterium sp.]